MRHPYAAFVSLLLLAALALPDAALAQSRATGRPPPAAPPPAVPPPRCITAYGQTVCGYDCSAVNGEVRCASTPYGACIATDQHVTCWDPAPQLAWATNGRLQQARCVRNTNGVACGYACVTAYDDARCSATPFGACDADQGALVCADPPVPVVLAHQGAPPAMACMRLNGQIACGYHCVSANGEVRCASTPNGICQVTNSHVVCWDPSYPTY